MLSITGEAAPCNPISQREGWPEAGSAMPALVTRPMKPIVTAINRLNTCIVVFAPSTRKKTAVDVPPNHAPQLGFPASATSAALAFWRRDREKSRLLKPQFRPSRNAPDHPCHAASTPRGPWKSYGSPALRDHEQNCNNRPNSGDSVGSRRSRMDDGHFLP